MKVDSLYFNVNFDDLQRSQRLASIPSVTELMVTLIMNHQMNVISKFCKLLCIININFEEI